ncbi:hypothetical protein [Phenylobacterium sp.]|uniref:hypothetical protein n=1 Tax=Phenylobacterium sp. TaxID=1871053 RepID=UPI0035628CA8
MPKPLKTMTLASAGVLALALACGPCRAADAPAKTSRYPAMAPIADYRQADEVAMARSAAPASISGEAEVMTLGARGYETAAKGKNGFVCMVQRSWASDFDDPEFWNPKERGPICFNPASVSSVLPSYLKRTEWVLAGVSKADLLARTKAAYAARTFTPPQAGAMAYMMSKAGYLNDAAGGHWHPHLMFFLPRTAPGDWGANLPGAPVLGAAAASEPVTVFFVPVANWSDGTPGAMKME